MNDTQRKALTEMLGECWHEKHWDSVARQNRALPNRTFLTPQDFFDVVRVLDRETISDILKTLAFKRQYNYWSLIDYVADAMKQPDFIEQFMRAVVEVKGVKG